MLAVRPARHPRSPPDERKRISGNGRGRTALPFLKSPLTRFVVAALAWLPVTFGAWYLLAPILLWPVRLLVQLVARFGFGDLVRAIDPGGTALAFITTLKPGEGVAAGVVSVDVNMLVYAFGMPLFAALTLAAREGRWWRTLALGYAVIVPFVAWGVLADFLKEVAIVAQPAIASQTGFAAWQRELIAFAYQFGSLILPAVVPAVLWVLLHRTFLERLRRRASAS
jgi:hypothetical protein